MLNLFLFDFRAFKPGPVFFESILQFGIALIFVFGEKRAMKAIGSCCIVALVGCLVVGFPSRSSSQETYFRDVTLPQKIAPVTPLQPEEEEKYNLMLGPVRFGSAVGLGLEWNDNIGYSHDDRKSDFILHPSLTVDATWRMTEMNTLRLSLGISYAKYFSHSEFDSHSALLSPNSEIGFTMNIGQVALTLRDRFSYEEDPYNVVTISNATRYRRFYNEASIQADWQVTESTKLTLGYSHFNVWTFGQDFKNLQRAVDTLYFRPSVQVTPAVTLGFNASASLINYSENVQNNGRSYLLGPFVEAKLTSNTKLYAEAGWQNMSFDNNGTISDTSSSSSWYLRSLLSNQWSESFSQHLSFTKSTETGYLTNSYELYQVEYGANWKMTPSLSSVGTLMYEHFADSGENTEKGSRYGASVGLRYIFTPSVTLSMDYRFLLKDSSITVDSYRQNMVLVSLYYNF